MDTLQGFLWCNDGDDDMTDNNDENCDKDHPLLFFYFCRSSQAASTNPIELIIRCTIMLLPTTFLRIINMQMTFVESIFQFHWPHRKMFYSIVIHYLRIVTNDIGLWYKKLYKNRYCLWIVFVLWRGDIRLVNTTLFFVRL